MFGKVGEDLKRSPERLVKIPEKGRLSG